MTGLDQLAFSEQHLHCGDVNDYQDLNVGYFLGPLDAEDVAKAEMWTFSYRSWVACIVSVLLPYNRVLVVQAL